MSLVKGLSILFTFSKNQLLDLLVHWIVSSLCHLTLFQSWLFTFFYSSGLCLHSSSSFSCRVRWFIWNFCFLHWPVLLWTSLWGVLSLCPILTPKKQNAHSFQMPMEHFQGRPCQSSKQDSRSDSQIPHLGAASLFWVTTSPTNLNMASLCP